MRLAAPAGATALTVAGQGFNGTVLAEGGEAVFPAETTANWLPGAYVSSWRVVARNGDVAFPNGPDITVELALANRRDVEQTHDEKLLTAAREVLAKASGSRSLTVTVAGFSSTYETRADLQAFIANLETRIARQRRQRRGLGPIKRSFI